MTKDFAAHNDKKSGAARLMKFIANALNDTPDTGTVGKLFTDADGNSKPYKKDKPDYGGGSRSTHMIDGKDAGMTKERCLVTKASGMGHDLDDCSVSRRGPGRLTCHMTCRTRQQSARRCRCNRRQQHEACLSTHMHTQHAHLQEGVGYATKAYLIAYTAA